MLRMGIRSDCMSRKSKCPLPYPEDGIFGPPTRLRLSKLEAKTKRTRTSLIHECLEKALPKVERIYRRLVPRITQIYADRRSPDSESGLSATIR